jgi:diadenosine tetraphosphate (Ap4A) HIT family hydrolase
LSDFILHPRLAADSHAVGELGLCSVRLLDDCRYPWVILVPRRAAVREIYELSPADRGMLLEESCRLGALMMQAFGGEKLNLGALGNLVPQLHLHHVVRRSGDPAWPGPVWGHSAAEPYPASELAQRLGLLRRGLDIPA